MSDENKLVLKPKTNYLIIAIVAIIFAVGGFLGGMKYQQSKLPSGFNFQGNGQFRAMRDRTGTPGVQRRAGSEAVRGEIIKQEAGSMTVKLPDDSTKLVLISENTEINQATKTAVEDLKTGYQVMVFGQTNPDGSVSASQIQLNFDFGGNMPPNN